MSAYNVVKANNLTKNVLRTRAELWFCLLNLYQESMRMRPCLYREKFLWVTHPARVNLSNCLFGKQLTPLPELKTALVHALILSP